MAKKAPHSLAQIPPKATEKVCMCHNYNCVSVGPCLDLNKLPHLLNKTFFNGFIIISVESSISPQSHSRPPIRLTRGTNSWKNMDLIQLQ